MLQTTYHDDDDDFPTAPHGAPACGVKSNLGYPIAYAWVDADAVVLHRHKLLLNEEVGRVNYLVKFMQRNVKPLKPERSL